MDIWPNAAIRNRYVHTSHQALRKCCGCIHLRVGATFSCLLWAGLSLYFSIISFQSLSPFFSHLDPPPLIVFGVVNLLLTMVAFFGLFSLFMNRWEYTRRFSHALWGAIVLVLVDGLVNVVLYLTKRGEFLSCKLWEDESKFGLLAIFIMIILYIYWAACIYSFSHKQGAVRVSEQKMMELGGMPPGGMMQPGMPPPPVAPPPPPPPMAGPGARSNVIVLNNEKPSSKQTTKKSKRSKRFPTFRKKSVQPSAAMLGFHMDEHGNMIDLESQHYWPDTNYEDLAKTSNHDHTKRSGSTPGDRY
ncbi:hypothetical protein BCR43DRAFT_22590 [Syncephalastrum racemosum]|uniref:Uncharacterized protein n=1 Tax=Syncephalastrum racemosum TaxID=13706 RepID=A0A1X2HT37_SYNRA|nr:hypothetical protein BCR43DRAFT_22590 [Syncephalastrum racemosum]